MERGIKFDLTNTVFRDYEIRLIDQLQLFQCLDLSNVATEEMCKDKNIPLDGPDYRTQLLDMLSKVKIMSCRQNILHQRMHDFLLCVPNQWLHKKAIDLEESAHEPRAILVPKLLRKMTTTAQTDLIQNEDISELNTIRLGIKYAPMDDFPAKISFLENIVSGQHDDTKLSNMCIHSIIGMAVIRSIKDACGGDIGLLTSMFEEKRKIIREQLAIVLPKFKGLREYVDVLYRSGP